MEFSAPVMKDMLVWDDHPPGIRQIHFEDLVASPVAVFCEIFEDLGLLPKRVSEWTKSRHAEQNTYLQGYQGTQTIDSYFPNPAGAKAIIAPGPAAAMFYVSNRRVAELEAMPGNKKAA